MACAWNGWTYHWRPIAPELLSHSHVDWVLMRQKILLMFFALFFFLQTSYSDENIEDIPPEITMGVLVNFENFIVSFKFGPDIVPSLLISV